MINREKTELMNRAALCDAQAKRGEKSIARWRRRDYLAVHLFLAWCSATAAYACLFTLWGLYEAGRMAEETISRSFLSRSAEACLLVYLVYIIIMMLIYHHIYSERYRRARAWQRGSQHALEALELWYEKNDRDSGTGTAAEAERDGGINDHTA